MEQRLKYWLSYFEWLVFFIWLALWTCSKAQWEETSVATASLRESEDLLASMVSTAAARCLLPPPPPPPPRPPPPLLLAESLNLLLSPLMRQTCLGLYQASPSHRLECKHTAVAQGTSVWSPYEPTVISKNTCWFREQTPGWEKIEAYYLYLYIQKYINILDF